MRYKKNCKGECCLFLKNLIESLYRMYVLKPRLFKMGLKKKILPLAFLGLSPTAGANTTAPKLQNNARDAARVSTVVKKPVNKIPSDTLKLDIAAFAREDTLGMANDMSHIDVLVREYNKSPNKFNPTNITKLLEIMRNPMYLYSQMRMPLVHARYVYDNISDSALNRMDIKNRMEIIANSVNKTVYDVTPDDAYLIMLNDNLAPLVKPSHNILFDKALNVALKNPHGLAKNNKNQHIVSSALQWSTSHADLDSAVTIYMRIFSAATDMISGYQLDISMPTDELNSINWLSVAIDNANHSIPSGSMMDKSISVRVPSQAVVANCNSVINRLALARLYNRAYWLYLSSGGMNKPAPGSSVPVDENAYKIMLDYMNIIYLIHNPRGVKNATAQLDTLLHAYPEVALFHEYFSAAYLDYNGLYDAMADYAAELRTSTKKNRMVTMSRDLEKKLRIRHKKTVDMRAQMMAYDIKVPEFAHKTNRMTWAGYCKSDMTASVVFDKIDFMLAKQIDLASSHKRTATQLLELQNASRNTEYTSRDTARLSK